MTPEYVEKEMEKRIKHCLDGLRLIHPFVPLMVGDDAYHANFPLVQRQNDVLTKVIKPFRLNHEDPQAIYEHGDAWVKKIERLKQRGALPEAVLFAVKPPPQAEAKRMDAFQAICHDLRKLDVQTVDEQAEQDIADFARG